jgi:hypothetical protein
MAKLRLTVLCVGMAIFCGLPAAAQYTTASLGGSVLDASGAAIAEAQVTARNIDTGFTQTTASDSTGAFLFFQVTDWQLRTAL